MDNLPNGGKVVIVDDCFQEILPLINICWLNFKWAEILQFCKTSARFLKVK